MIFYNLSQANVAPLLPKELQPIFTQLSQMDFALLTAKNAILDHENHAAFAFIRSKPVRLESPARLFGSIVPTKHIQEVSVCRAIWNRDGDGWVPDESNPFFVAHIASSCFSEAVMNANPQEIPMTYLSFDGVSVSQTHEELSAHFVLDWIAEKSGNLNASKLLKPQIDDLKLLINSDSTASKVKSAIAGLRVDHLLGEHGSFQKKMMHEALSRIDSKVKTEVIHDLSRTAHAVNNAPHLALSHDTKSDVYGQVAFPLVCMREFYGMHVSIELLEAQAKILNYLLSMHDELPNFVNDMRNRLDTVNSHLRAYDRRVTDITNPTGETYYLAPAPSAGTMSISRPSGGPSFFGDRSDGYSHAEISFGFGLGNIDSYGEINVRPARLSNIRLAMTGLQFMDMLQSANIGTWTKCTLRRIDANAVPYPVTARAHKDGAFSEKSFEKMSAQAALAERVGLLRSIAIRKSISMTARVELCSILDEILALADTIREDVASKLNHDKAELIETHRLSNLSEISNILKSSGDLSSGALERIEQALQQIESAISKS